MCYFKVKHEEEQVLTRTFLVQDTGIAGSFSKKKTTTFASDK